MSKAEEKTIAKTALFSISSLGLGHAVRTAPIIRAYLETHAVHIVSSGAALRFLREEFAGTAAAFYELGDYPPLERGRGSWRFYWYMVRDSLSTVAIIREERRFIRGLAAKIRPQFIIADGKYGSHAPGVPSFLISHQISFSMPRGFGAFRAIADSFNYRTFRRFDALIIPDYADPEHNLAGKLSHHPMLAKLDHRYVGILTLSRREPDVRRDIAALFTVSGYLDEFRPTFVNKLLELAGEISGKKVFVLGRPGEGTHQVLPERNIEIYPSVSGALRNDLFNRAQIIVSRSGYTTIMDLVELGTPAVLVPTPGQTEQEYLAEYLGATGCFIAASSEAIDPEMIRAAASAKLFDAPWRTAESVRQVQALVSERVL